MADCVHTDRGQGPVVVLLHGVGVGPESFAQLAKLLERHHRVVVLARPVGSGGRALPLIDQADRIAQLIVELGAVGGRLVGVSGGATLGLLLATRHHEVAGGLVLHEPLVGRLAPELHARFRDSAASAAQGEAETMAVVRQVMGDETWDRLGPSAQAASMAQAPRWQGEIAEFAAFDPTVGSFATLRDLPLLTTVGTRAGAEQRVAERRAVAEVLAVVTGAEIAEIPDAGNAVQLDQPEAFARIIASWRMLPVGGTHD